MADNVLQELEQWWLSAHASDENPFEKALRSLNVLSLDEALIESKVLYDWNQDSEETYVSLGYIVSEGSSRVRTTHLMGYAVVTPPGLSIDERITSWSARNKTLINSGVKVPSWFLIWRGTIFVVFPPFSLSEYLEKYSGDLNDVDIDDLVNDLYLVLCGLSQVAASPLSLLSDLRTDGLAVFYCGLGFNLGDVKDDPETILETQPNLVKQYEDEILGFLPENFRNRYRERTLKK